MSLAAISWAMDQCRDVDLSDGEKVLLVVLGDFANEDGECWPSIDALARKCGRGDRTARQRLAGLEDKGVLTREQRRRANGSLTSNVYRLAMPPQDPGGVNRVPGRNWRIYVAAGGGRIKVGVSVDPAARVRCLAQQTGVSLALLADVPGSRSEERAIHEALASRRLYGEWYEDGAESRRICLQMTVGKQPADGNTGAGPEPSVLPLLEKKEEEGVGVRGGGGRRGRAPTQVGGKRVSEDEENFALMVLAIFNEVSGKRFGSKEALGKIVLRHREHRGLSAEDHRRIITEQFERPWWKGDPSPNVIYGNGDVFDRAVNNVRGGRENGGHDASAFSEYR